MSNTLQVKSSFTTCPHCSIRAIPQEERMAIPTADDRVFCYSCRNITGNLPYAIIQDVRDLPVFLRESVITLMRHPAPEDLKITFGPVAEQDKVPSTYSLTRIHKPNSGFDASNPLDAARAVAAVAQGNADVLIAEADRIDIRLSCGPLHSVQISYLPEDLRAAQTTGDKAPCSVAIDIASRLPSTECQAVHKLADQGFEHVSHDIDSLLRHVTLTRAGVKARVEWYV